jgi:hypothetical protein
VSAAISASGRRRARARLRHPASRP